MLAERAAWDFIEELPAEQKFELAVVNPGYVMGPLLYKCHASSTELAKRILERAMPAVPKVNMQIVDVRDVAAAHIQVGPIRFNNIVRMHVTFEFVTKLIETRFLEK